ncbi:MAG: DUF3782 domain-containing protein [Methylovulum sp.]|jgi:hypothetical protein|nr:DUF3782 domain-containing protein [Methylovulum sp.]MCF7998114.1 DUF3782 domain-containing protein [Methylovulum sp.]
MSTAAEEIWAILREVAQSQKETDRRFIETDRQFKETDRRFIETDRQFKETDRKLKELGKQIGGLGEKFGSFTEGLALPSMEKILQQRFGMEVISPSVRVSKGGEHLEIDVLAYANSDINQVYVVEVKSHVREEAITQIKNLLERFRVFFPEHKEKTIYGILAAVDISQALKERVLREGIYVARIHDQVFDMDSPEGFRPKAY